MTLQKLKVVFNFIRSDEMSRKFALGCFVLASLVGGVVGCSSDDEATPSPVADTGTPDSSSTTDTGAATDTNATDTGSASDTPSSETAVETKLGEPKQYVLPLSANTH